MTSMDTMKLHFSEGEKFETEADSSIRISTVDPSYKGKQYWYMYGKNN